MKWIILGTNWISEGFVQNLRHIGEEVVGVLSRKQETAEVFAKKMQIPNAEILSVNPTFDYDAVYIGTPNATHYELAKRFLKLRKHVLVEKIMTHSYATTKELFDLAKANKVKVMEGFVHITNPNLYGKTFNFHKLQTNLMKVSRHIKNNTYKQSSTFNRNMYGGALADLGVYPIALAVVLLGKIRNFKLRNPQFLNGVEVDVEVELQHEQGGISQFRVSKFQDGNNALIIDNKDYTAKFLPTLEWRMSNEIDVFVNKKHALYEWVSLEVARVVELMKNELKVNIEG